MIALIALAYIDVIAAWLLLPVAIDITRNHNWTTRR